MVKINDKLTAKITHLRTMVKDGAVVFGPRKYDGEVIVNKAPCKTIAEIITNDGTVVSVGTADCSDKDMFSRKKGRQIAIGRAMKSVES